MKRFFRFLLFCYTISFIVIVYRIYFVSPSLTPEEKEFLKRKKIITFVSQKHYPPFEFIDKNNTKTGMVIELIKWISVEFGFKTKFLHTSFYNAQQMVLNGEADVLTSFFYSKERDKKFDFTKQIFSVPTSIFVRENNKNIKNINDLNEKRIAIQKGDYAISFLKKRNIKFKLIATKSFFDATDKLINGEADAIVGDEQIVLFYIQQKELFSKIKIVGEPLYVGIDCMAVKEGNKILVSILNKGIELAQKRGIIKLIEKKWLGNRYVKKEYFKYFITIIAILFFILSIGYAWVYVLRKTVKKKTEELRKSEEKFRSFFENTSFPYLVIDVDKTIDCNEAAVKFLKAPDKKSLFVKVGNLSPEYQPDGELSRAKAKRLVKEVLKTGKMKVFEWKLKSFNNEKIWVLMTLSRVPFEDRMAVLATWVDISEIKKLQRLLEEEKEQLEVALKSIGDAVIKVDINGKIDLMNYIAEELTGWKLNEAKGKDLKEVFKIYNEITGEIQENPVEKVIKSGKIQSLANHTILVSKTGKKYNITDSAAPIITKDGKTIGIILVFRDETEKIRQEKELIKAEKLKSLGILAGGIAHDFNNLLTGVYGHISLAKDLLPESHKAYKIIEKAVESIDKASRLTKQLLTFSKGGEPVLESFDIVKLIYETVCFTLRGTNIKPVFNFLDKECKIVADKSQIEQVISNITINAKQAMEKSGNFYVKLEQCENPFDLKGKFLKITMRDEGCGIPKDKLEKIFDPYFTTKSDGSGLGLTTVYSVIKKHKGKIFVESEVGKGTTFTIYLPFIEFVNFEREIKKTLNDNKNFQMKKKLKILLMEDNEDIQALLREIFELLGHNLIITSTGEDAIKEYKEALKNNEKFDIVILDLTVPGGKGGKETIKELLEIDPDVFAIVASGYSDDEVIANYKKYGFKGRLIKPYTYNDIVELIKTI